MSEMPRWTDRHSINCCICENLIDEREAMSIAGGGSYCSEHHNMIEALIYKLCAKLRMRGHSFYFETDINEILDFCGDTIYLDDALAKLHKIAHTSFYSVEWHREAHSLYRELTQLIGV